MICIGPDEAVGIHLNPCLSTGQPASWDEVQRMTAELWPARNGFLTVSKHPGLTPGITFKDRLSHATLHTQHLAEFGAAGPEQALNPVNPNPNRAK
jgi:hypothetical protein